MGMPSFFRWLVDKYPKIVVDPSKEMEFDNLYLDMNAIVHPCFHPESVNITPPTTFEDVFQNIYDYIDNLFNIVKPRKLLYLAIDGVAPRAKMNQQRGRRFRNAKDKEISEKMEEDLMKQFEAQGKKVLPKEDSELSDSNIIAPGTQFMSSLSEKLQEYIRLRMSQDPQWKNLKVILSDANVPGEGEHKILLFIRAQRGCKDYDPNTKHCLYGLDADLIMLALATHEVHFSILREKIVGGSTLESCLPGASSISDDLKLNTRAPVMNIAFQFLNVWVLREYLKIDMNIIDLPENFKGNTDLERIIDDFVFMCFFAGNDFLPHMPTLAIHEGAIDLLMHVYKTEFKKLGGYLVDTQKIDNKRAAYIKLKRVEKFILSVGQYEEKIFKKRSEMRERMIRRLIYPVSAGDGECEPVDAKKCAYSISTADNSDVLQNTTELKQKLKEKIRRESDTFRSGGLGTDKVRLSSPGYKERYYDEKFSTNDHGGRESKRKEVVQKYTEGLCWVLKYYYEGVPSWNWFYPFHYGPFASDFKGLSGVNIMFQKGLPFKPFDLLMGILPPRSADALPGPYKKLMLDENSKIIDFYPTDFKVDMDGKRYLWQAVCILPFIQEERLLTETKVVEKELKDEDKRRNAEYADRLFVSLLSSFGEQISAMSKSFASFSNTNGIDINSSPSGMSGFVRMESNGSTATDFNCKSESRDVLCVFYELPCYPLQKPHLHEGVNIPEQVVFEEDVTESVLWHESSGKAFNRNLPQNCIPKLKFSLKNEQPDFIYKEGGIGWSAAGRGKAVCSYSAGSGSARPKSIGHRQLSEPKQGFRPFFEPKDRGFRQPISISTSPNSSSVDWRVHKQSGITPAEQGSWRKSNTNHAWTNTQTSFYLQQPTEQNILGWRTNHSQENEKTFSGFSTRQESYGRGNFMPRADPYWKAKRSSGGNFY